MPKPGLPKKYAKMGFKKGWRAFKATKRSTQRKRTTTRKGTSPLKRSNNKGARKMKGIPHPSITGMASGLAVAAYLNSGSTTVGRSGQRITTEGVIKDITDGQLGTAFNTLAGNAMGMIGTDAGRKTLVVAGVTAALGAVARRQFPNLKLGSTKLYFRL